MPEITPAPSIETPADILGFDPSATQLTTDEGDIKELDEIEAEMIRFAIELYNGKLSEVAKRLGIGRSTLYRRLKELGIESDKSGDLAVGG